MSEYVSIKSADGTPLEVSGTYDARAMRFTIRAVYVGDGCDDAKSIFTDYALDELAERIAAKLHMEHRTAALASERAASCYLEGAL